ncbi:MAG TPA: Gfo/Idh/MocA family oxidoreductase [Candidatus Paceibacterota bacterium]|nr:Gfo/Idh/MocA family oxidoreductase [Candidatus Paceibacterota bacterium]
MTTNIAIIGAGLIGKKRAKYLPKNIQLKIVCDINRQIGESFAALYNCNFEKDWRKVVDNKDIDAVIIATTNNYLTPIALEMIKKKKHVFLEKPGARDLKEFEKLLTAQKKNKVVVRIGYNHRYHPAIMKAKEIIAGNKYGKVMFIRARYGHGGRLGYENEWRFDRKIAGGGILLDQGCHLIDLVNYYVGEMQTAIGFTQKMFWSDKLEDNAFFILKNKKGNIAHLSASCTEWKNIFVFEIMLEKAKIQINGLGKSYGKETITLYKMKKKMGPPDIEEITDFPAEDVSWKLENQEFFNAIGKKDYSNKKLQEGHYAIKKVFDIYKFSSKKG